MRRIQRWNLRDCVEERNPILLLGRPLGASVPGSEGCSALAGFVFMDRPHQLSAAAALSFLSLSPWISISQQASKERQDTPTPVFKNRHGLGGTELMDTGTMLELDCTLVHHLTEAQFGFP